MWPPLIPEVLRVNKDFTVEAVENTGKENEKGGLAFRPSPQPLPHAVVSMKRAFR